MPLPFIRQYPANEAFPTGRRCLAEITLSRSAEDIGRTFIAFGGRYVCEILLTGKARIAACLMIEGKQKDVVVEESDNGPPLRDCVERVVRASVDHLPKAKVLPFQQNNLDRMPKASK